MQGWLPAAEQFLTQSSGAESRAALRARRMGERQSRPSTATEALVHAIAQALDRVVADFEKHENWRPQDGILAYCAIRGELDLLHSWVVPTCQAQGWPLYLPRVATQDGKPSQDMEFVSVDPRRLKDSLGIGPFGIPQPSNQAQQRFAGGKALILTPGLAADPQGFRLGYGGGYYDRFLCTIDSLSKSVFPLEHQGIVPTVWPEPQDVPVHWVVTERKVWQPRP